MINKFGYNLAAIVVDLHEKIGIKYGRIQNYFGKKVEALNDHLKDISTIKHALTAELPKGQAALSHLSDVIERIQLVSKDLITAGKDSVWKTKDAIQAQITLFQDKSQSITQEISLLYTKMGQQAKETTEVDSIFFDMVRKHGDLLKALQLTR